MKCYHGGMRTVPAGDRGNTTIHQQGENAEPAHVSRRHLPPGGHVFFTLCRNGSHFDLKEEMGHPRKPPTQPGFFAPYSERPSEVFVVNISNL